MNPRQWFGAVIATLVTLWLLSEVSSIVLSRLDASSPFGRVGLADISAWEVASGLLILALEVCDANRTCVSFDHAAFHTVEQIHHVLSSGWIAPSQKEPIRGSRVCLAATLCASLHQNR